MKPSYGARTPVVLSDLIHRRLNTYALAASVAGVSALCLSQYAEGKIVYTPLHKAIKAHQHYPLDLNHDGITDFTIQRSSYGNDFLHLSGVAVAWPQNNGAAGSATSDFGGPGAFALQRGRGVGPNYPFSGFVMASVQTSFGSVRVIGQWPNAGTRYLGLKFRIHGKTHYGWARLNVVTTKRAIKSVTLTGYAYETIPNKTIATGKTKGQDESNNEAPHASQTLPATNPAALGMLAMGAPRLRSGTGSSW
jgi:hypothetical protein